MVKIHVIAGFPETRPNPSAYTPPKDKVIINEVGNYANNAHDWIELRNVTNAAQSINELETQSH